MASTIIPYLVLVQVLQLAPLVQGQGWELELEPVQERVLELVQALLEVQVQEPRLVLEVQLWIRLEV